MQPIGSDTTPQEQRIEAGNNNTNEREGEIEFEQKKNERE